MTIHLTPEQERRIRAVVDRGVYKSVDQRAVPRLPGTPEETDTLLAEGLASKQLMEDEFLLP